MFCCQNIAIPFKIQIGIYYKLLIFQQNEIEIKV